MARLHGIVLDATPPSRFTVQFVSKSYLEQSDGRPARLQEGMRKELDTDGVDFFFASLTGAAAVPTRAVHAAAGGAAAGGWPLQVSSLWRPPCRVVEVSIVDAEQRRDGSGQRFGSFTIRSLVETGDGASVGVSALAAAAAAVMESERRYSDFVALHAEVHVALALPAAFPVAPSVMPYLSTRQQQLQEYLRTAVARASATTAPLALLAFLRPLAFTATVTPPTECLVVIQTAGCEVALTILRAHTGVELLQQAALARIRQLAEHGDESFTGAGAGAWYPIQDGAAGMSRLGASTAVRGDGKAEAAFGDGPFGDGPFGDGPLGDGPLGEANVETAGGAGPGACARSERDGGRERSGRSSTDARASLPATAADAAQAALVRAGAAEALTAALRRHCSRPAAATACAALRALAVGTQSWHTAARTALERSGVIQPLVDAMAAQPAHPALLALAAEVIGELTCACRDPRGVSSHFAFEAARRVAAAMAEHPSHLQLQSACCGATAALARRSDVLGRVLASGGAAAACIAAMRRFRFASRSAATLQTNACAALQALAVHPQALADLDRLGGTDLFLSTITEHGSDSESDAGVVAGGWGALLGMLGLPEGVGNGGGAPPGEARHTDAPGASRPAMERLPPRQVREQLLPLLWRCIRIHPHHPAVLCACAAVLAALLGEDARRAGRDDLRCCADAQTMHDLLHRMGLFFFEPGQNAPGGGRYAVGRGVDSSGARALGFGGSGASLVRHVSRACEALVEVGGPRAWFAQHELRVLHGQVRAFGEAVGEPAEAPEQTSALRRIDDALAAVAPLSRAKTRA